MSYQTDYDACQEIAAEEAVRRACPECKKREARKVQIDSESAEEVSIIAAFNRRLREISAPQCPTHKRYQAKRKPTSTCEACWRRYIHLNPR